MIFGLIILGMLAIAYSMSALPCILISASGSGATHICLLWLLPFISLLLSWLVWWGITGIGVAGWTLMLIESFLAGFVPLLDKPSRVDGSASFDWTFVLFIGVPFLISFVFLLFRGFSKPY
jgi:hypothetical protein